MSRSCRKFENKHNNGSGRKKVNYDGKIILNKQIHNRLINLLSNLKIVGGQYRSKTKAGYDTRDICDDGVVWCLRNNQ